MWTDLYLSSGLRLLGLRQFTVKIPEFLHASFSFSYMWTDLLHIITIILLLLGDYVQSPAVDVILFTYTFGITYTFYWVYC